MSNMLDKPLVIFTCKSSGDEPDAQILFIAHGKAYTH
jgi:hypothetical protein